MSFTSICPLFFSPPDTLSFLRTKKSGAAVLHSDAVIIAVMRR